MIPEEHVYERLLGMGYTRLKAKQLIAGERHIREKRENAQRVLNTTELLNEMR